MPGPCSGARGSRRPPLTRLTPDGLPPTAPRSALAIRPCSWLSRSLITTGRRLAFPPLTLPASRPAPDGLGRSLPLFPPWTGPRPDYFHRPPPLLRTVPPTGLTGTRRRCDGRGGRRSWMMRRRDRGGSRFRRHDQWCGGRWCDVAADPRAWSDVPGLQAWAAASARWWPIVRRSV